MAKNLLIVESPAKAKTIEKYLGKDFKVSSSYGHIRDLSKNDMGVDISNNFKPKYEISPDKKKTVKELKSLVKKSEAVWLATDEDREGEAISWHLAEVLGLDPATTRRIVFREITKPAIQRAVQQPRTIDINLVNAQQARRILDRLVGFELSELLWKKVKGQLSAGRVQSVAVRLIAERERDIQNFETTDYFKVYAYFKVETASGSKVELRAECPDRLSSEKEAQEFLQASAHSEFTISDKKVKKSKQNPKPPFTTSTLQQEASRKLYFSVQRTMSVAQRLYEQGHITYMRTDSTNLSDVAIASISKEIRTSFGDKYLHNRKYKNKSTNAQEAHEAIRPTYVEKAMVSADRDMQRLYELIRNRALASQMAAAEFENTTIDISISGLADRKLIAKGKVLTFDGHLRVYIESQDDPDEDEVKGMLPPLKVGQILLLDHMDGIQRFTRPPSRYTEASLVKELEAKGIGRPSTYSPTITKIMDPKRGYVTKESRDGEKRKYTLLRLQKGDISQHIESEVTGASSNKLYCSDIGMVVTDFLMEHFEKVMDYSFTARIEEQFDDIADGEIEWQSMLDDFYTPFHSQIIHIQDHADRFTGERILGNDPETGKTILARMTKFGPVVQKGKPEELAEGEKPTYANLRKLQSIETIGLEEALDLFQLPKTIGSYKGEEIQVNIGRYGPYVRFGDKFVSIPKGVDPFEVNLNMAMPWIEAKIKEDQPIAHFEEMPITKGKGRFGPYLKWNGLYVNIPKKINPEDISTSQAIEMVKEKKEKEAKRFIQKWPDEKISIQNGRWGPFIKYKRKNVKLPKTTSGEKMTAEEAKELSLSEVKEIIEKEIPGSFSKKKKKGKKKSKAK